MGLGAGSLWNEPHSGQSHASSGSWWPHCVQDTVESTASRCESVARSATVIGCGPCVSDSLWNEPHSVQNHASTDSLWPHCGQCSITSSDSRRGSVARRSAVIGGVLCDAYRAILRDLNEIPTVPGLGSRRHLSPTSLRRNSGLTRYQCLLAQLIPVLIPVTYGS